MSDKPTCKTCAYWKAAPPNGIFPIGDCHHPAMVEGNPDAHETIMRGDRGPLPTTPGFGCIHHEPENQS